MAQRLTGMVEQRVDDRQRIAIPARFKDALRHFSGSSEADLSVTVGLGLEGRLCIFPKTVHDELLDHLDSQPAFDPKWRRIRNMVEGSAEEQALDKQSRIKIPALLARRLELEGTIVVMGAGRHLVLMTMAEWERELDEYATFADELAAEERARG